MKDIAGGILAVLFVIAVVLGIGWIAEGNNFFMYKFFAPKVEQVRYNTYKQSQSYNDGIAKDVAEYHLRYISATPDQKAAMASIILQEVSDYDTTKLPPADQAFINQLRAKQDLAQ